MSVLNKRAEVASRDNFAVLGRAHSWTHYTRKGSQPRLHPCPFSVTGEGKPREGQRDQAPNTLNIILRHALALPMRSGGLGLTDLTIVNSIAYVASASGTSQKEITNMVFTMIKKWLDNSEYHPQQLSQPLRAALRPPTYEHSHTLLRLSNKNHAAFLRFTYSTFHRQVPTGTHAKACDAPNCAQANNIFDTDGSGYRAFNHWVSCVHRRFPNVSHLHASTLRLIAMLIHERSDGTVQCVVEPEEYDVTLCTVCKYWFLAGSAKFHDCVCQVSSKLRRRHQRPSNCQ